MNIDDLSQAKTLNDQHEVVVYDPGQRATRKATLPQVADYVLASIEGTPDETVYSLNGTTVTVLPATPGGSAWAQITLAAAVPALTVILPGPDDRAHGQEVLITCTQAVAALTINAQGSALHGAPSGMPADGALRLRYDSINDAWFMISSSVSISAPAAPAAPAAPSGSSTPTTTAVSASNPMYIGHRGSGLLYPEETNTAYRNSLSDGCQFLESDARLLTDGALALMHDTTVDRVTTGTGNVTTFNSISWKALNLKGDTLLGLTNKFSNTLHPELLDDHLVTFADKAVFVIEDNDFTAMPAIVANLIRRGIRRDQVLLQCFNTDQLKVATDAGYEGIYLCSAGGYANVTTIKNNRVNWVGAGISTTPTSDTELQQWMAAGLKVVCWTVNRRSIRDAKLALGVIGFFSDDPAYLKGNAPIYTRDQFSRQMWVPGMVGGASALGTDASRGVFAAPNKWGYNVTTAGYSGCLQGYLCPILGKSAPSNYTIDLKLTFTAYTDPTRFASVFISPTDQQFVDSTTDDNSGYHFVIRQNGTLDIYRKDKNVASAKIGTQTGAAFADNTDTSCRITVTDTAVKLAVLNGSGVEQQVCTVNTTTYRGGYIHLGRSGAACLFSDVIVKAIGA